MLTPDMAAQRGIELVHERDSHSIRIILYREDRRLRGDVYLVTVGHIVSTVTSLERVGQFAFLHS